MSGPSSVPAELRRASASNSAPMPLVPEAPPLRVRGSLQRDLVRLGVLPCAVLAVVLTAWFTHARLANLEAVFTAEGQAIARQVAAMSDLSLFAGDVPALQNVVNAALRSGQAARIEISNSAGVFVAAGPPPSGETPLRTFSAPVTLREASRAAAFAPAGSTAAGDAPIGLVQAFLDTTAYSMERTRSLMTGIGLALLALLMAWGAVRHMARNIARPLRRVTRTVAALQAGQFDARCDVTAPAPRVGRGEAPYHEFAALARDVNRLAERLQQHQQVSEQRVREATAVALLRMTEAEQAAMSRARFLAAASHDLRQPLHAMGLFIDGLLSSATETQRPALAHLQESAAFMSVLLDDLLEISRLDAQVLAPTLADVPLAPLFDALAAQHAARAAEARVRLVWRDRGLAVHTDSALLQRVIGNLVANAIQHAPPEGTVLVAARRCSEGVRIEVRDSGMGIAPIHQSRIFDEFYQVANTERDRRQGFGLGLAICARVAALLGTRVALRSALGRGSTFSIALPAAEAAPTLAAQPAAPGPAAALHGLRCLVVDDDPAILEGTAALLRCWECRCDTATSERDALARLGDRHVRYDVVLCDLQLAGGEDGMTIIDAAAKLQPQAQTVMVSGATGPEDLQRLRLRGVTLLTKPVAPAKLRALLATRRLAA